MTQEEKTAHARQEEALELIRRAYRLHPLDPEETISGVRTAIADGLQAMCDDLNEQAANA